MLALEKSENIQLGRLDHAALKQADATLREDRPGLYSLPGVVSDEGRTTDTTLRLLPFINATEYRIWIPLVQPQ